MSGSRSGTTPAAVDVDVEGPLLSDGYLEDRAYQRQLAATACGANTLVCLPTGLGKTAVSLLVTAARLHESDQGKALLLAPTKPLTRQHASFYREALEIPDDHICVFTGDTAPADRAALWESARVVMATPQVVENDLVGNRISLADVVHCTFDECHRATGEYAYNYIAERYHADAGDPLVTAMSASPGGDTEDILTVCQNLGVDTVDVMTEDDADVDSYTHETDVTWENIELPDALLEIRDGLNEVISDRLGKLKSLGVTSKTSPDVSQTQLNKMRAKLQRMMDNDQSDAYKGMSTHAEVMKLRRAVELVETQSVESLRRYFERQKQAARSSGASKATQRLVSDPTVRRAMRTADTFDDIHPKLSKTRILLAQTLGIGGGERAIVFTESRDTAEALVEFLSDSFDVRRFVGQSDKDRSEGMTQSEQGDTLDAFRAGEFDVLVSTSVAEEGLDVPEVDLVCFYEPVPTAIRSIQRKGRTGRQADGEVVVLMAKDTRDEAFFWISRRRERQMQDELMELKGATADIEAELDNSQAALEAFNRDESQPESADAESAAAVSDESGGGAATEDESAATWASASGNQPGLTDFDTAEASTTDTDTETAADGVADASSDTSGSEGDTSGVAGDATADADDSEDESDTTSDPGDGNNSDTPAGVVATAEADTDDETEVVVDQRELDSSIAKDLSTREGIYTRLETLAVGDYVLSDRVAVERKSTADFLDSMLDGDHSLFEQVKDLSRAYGRPLVIVEGDDLFGERNVNPEAIRGALSALAVDFGVSVLRTRDQDDTARLLETIARREQEVSDRTVSAHGEKSAKTIPEQQEYVVSSIADIGPITAQSLLEYFGTVEAVMTARDDDLQEVDGVGEVTASRIREVVGGEYG